MQKDRHLLSIMFVFSGDETCVPQPPERFIELFKVLSTEPFSRAPSRMICKWSNLLQVAIELHWMHRFYEPKPKLSRPRLQQLSLSNSWRPTAAPGVLVESSIGRSRDDSFCRHRFTEEDSPKGLTKTIDHYLPWISAPSACLVNIFECTLTKKCRRPDDDFLTSFLSKVIFSNLQRNWLSNMLRWSSSSSPIDTSDWLHWFLVKSDNRYVQALRVRCLSLSQNLLAAIFIEW